MRMSCNGCRVLRKGCSDNCSIRPCLQWISNPEAQANATLFLAKFYGRAGLLNLINAGPEHLRPAIFRSLLYEACGRIVNPIYGSVGLLWSGSWQLCQAAAEAVLKGAPIVQVASEAAGNPGPPMKAYDIRHVSKEANQPNQELHRVKTRHRFKQVAKKTMSHLESAPELVSSPVCNLRWRDLTSPDDLTQDPSHESSLSHHSEPNAESDSAFSVETVEASLAAPAEPEQVPDRRGNDTELDLGLTLGHGHVVSHARPAHATRHVEMKDDVDAKFSNPCNVELGLVLTR